MKGVKVMIVEDEIVIAQDIAMLLKKHGAIVTSICYTGHKALNSLESVDADIAILDISLGNGPTGIEVAQAIKLAEKCPYIFLTSFSDPATLQEAQETSPYGYLVKPFQEATLLATLSLALSNYAKQQETIHFGAFPNLTDQEKQLCMHLYQGKSYKEVAADSFISINTVRYHVKNIYLKLDVNSRAELIAALIEGSRI